MASLTICQERSTLSALSATKNKVVSKDASGLFLIGVPMGNPPIFNGVHLYYLCGHFQFHAGCNAANAHVRAVVVVSPEPLRGVILGLLDGFDDVLADPFVPDGAVVARDVGVLLRLVGLAALEGDLPLFGPSR